VYLKSAQKYKFCAFLQETARLSVKSSGSVVLALFVIGADKAYIAITGGAVQLNGIGKKQYLLVQVVAMDFPVAFRTDHFVLAEYGG
jgi:hypothetical protein